MELPLVAGDIAVDFGEATAVDSVEVIAVDHPVDLVDSVAGVSVVVVPAAIGRNKKRLAKPTF